MTLRYMILQVCCDYMIMIIYGTTALVRFEAPTEAASPKAASIAKPWMTSSSALISGATMGSWMSACNPQEMCAACVKQNPEGLDIKTWRYCRSRILYLSRSLGRYTIIFGYLDPRGNYLRYRPGLGPQS